MPVHDAEHIVLKDVTQWKDRVHAPAVDCPEETWAPAIAHAEAVNRDEKYVAIFVAPGLFEMCHHLMGMEGAMMSFYDEPDRMHELIEYLIAYEFKLADQLVEHLHPDALFHHDDWGGQRSTFLSPPMFRTFFLEPYKKIYAHWKQRGVDLVVHHSDSYAATLVPDMIEMGIDVWQGVMTTNNTPELIEKYGSQITFMGDIDSGPVDVVDWTPDLVAEHVEKACLRCGKRYFVPCLTQGGNFSSFPGVYDAVSEAIDQMSARLF
jgi:uroporphyrinogen-III decarboxylase